MSYQDKVCVCRDCSQEFTFTAQEQKVFNDRGFRPPTRCTECHGRRDSSRRYNRGGDVEMHIAKCSVCGKDARLPFKPVGRRPVYCSECFAVQLKENEKPYQNEFVVRRPEKVMPEIIVNTDGSSFGGFDLDPRLERAVREAGYDVPTPVQAATIPLALKGADLIGTAQTGTGKTAAFVLPILQHLLSNPAEKLRTRVLVLTPTRELAEQINDAFRQLGRYTRIRTATVYGGVGMYPQERALRSGADVIVACPGRLLDHMARGNTNFSNVEKVVLDEADRMLDMGFLPPIKRILANLPSERHTMLFSATFARELMQLVADALKDPKRIDVGISAPAKTVAHALYPCPQHLKTSLVLELLDKTDTNSVLIFTRTKHRANKVAEQIEKAGYGTTALHSNKSQSQRQLALNDFKSGRCQVLVATDIAARGLDVDTISHVINYDIPDTADTYIHRIGRTGRAEREGDAMTLVTGEDRAIIRDIEKALGSPIERRKLDDFDYGTTRPIIDEFKRPPMPQRKPKADVGRSRSYSSKPKSDSPARGGSSASGSSANSPKPFYARFQNNGKKAGV